MPSLTKRCCAAAIILAALLGLTWHARGSNELRLPTITDALALKDLGFIALSSDGTLIAVELSGGISIFEINEPGKIKYALKGNSPSWSPSGQSLAFLAGDQGNEQINVWNRHTQRIEVITAFPGGITPATSGVGSSHLSWSPDSEKIAFCSRELGPGVLRSDPPPKIRVLKPDTPFDQMTAGLFRYDLWEDVQPYTENFSLKRMQTVWADPEKGLNKLFVVNIYSRQLRRLTQRDQHFFPSWSPDGTKIACI